MANWHVQLLYLQICCDIHARSCFPWAISSHWLNIGAYQKWAILAWSGHYLATVWPFWLGDWHLLSLADTYPEQHCSSRLSSSIPPDSLFLQVSGLNCNLKVFFFFFFNLLFLSLPLSFPNIYPNKSFAYLFLLTSVSLRPLTNIDSSRNSQRKQVRMGFGVWPSLKGLRGPHHEGYVGRGQSLGTKWGPQGLATSPVWTRKCPMERAMIQAFERHRGDNVYENTGSGWLLLRCPNSLKKDHEKSRLCNK